MHYLEIAHVRAYFLSFDDAKDFAGWLATTTGIIVGIGYEEKVHLCD